MDERLWKRDYENDTMETRLLKREKCSSVIQKVKIIQSVFYQIQVFDLQQLLNMNTL